MRSTLVLGLGDVRRGDWDKIYDMARPMEEQREVSISDIEMDLSGNGR